MRKLCAQAIDQCLCHLRMYTKQGQFISGLRESNREEICSWISLSMLENQTGWL